jgi:hypothetical protein
MVIFGLGDGYCSKVSLKVKARVQKEGLVCFLLRLRAVILFRVYAAQLEQSEFMYNKSICLQQTETGRASAKRYYECALAI